MGDDSYSEDVYSEFEEDAMVHEPQMIDTRPAWTQREESEPGERELRSHLYAQLKNSGVIGNVKVNSSNVRPVRIDDAVTALVTPCSLNSVLSSWPS